MARTVKPRLRLVPRAEDRRICAAMPSPRKQAKEFDRKAQATIRANRRSR